MTCNFQNVKRLLLERYPDKDAKEVEATIKAFKGMSVEQILENFEKANKYVG
ncbi:hypothetical protein NVP1121O_249 [Vibrio phage 1.121.O._10N.286.46.C4]|nr:hypothetical protein NVP1121O_249 [Vibrio phage 1.121.O._10N.286.46.C4]